MLSQKFDYEDEKLAKAIRLTFDRRGTESPTEVVTFTERFMTDKEKLWKTFRTRFQNNEIPGSFDLIVTSVDQFILSVIESISGVKPSSGVWKAPGPWH